MPPTNVNMTLNDTHLNRQLDLEEIGREMFELVTELFPLCRSITGDGNRATLRHLKRYIPLTLHEVPSGTKVFDWTVPLEWNVRDAFIKNARGERMVDFRQSNLHIVNYSIPIHQKMSLTELKPHLVTLPEHPDWIPYRTTYYKPTWGFCLTHRRFLELSEGEYEVCIDSSLEDGHLTYGEYYLSGEIPDEILISTHICHPSLANDALSGNTVAAFLAKRIASLPRRYSYRFLFIPATIGAITWLCLNESKVSQIRHGLVLTGLGDAKPLSYKRSRQGEAEIDRVAVHVLQQLERDANVLDFSPYGYDERQFCSPGFNLPVGRLSRAIHGTFPEYHTSADNLAFVRPHSLAKSLSICLDILWALEQNRTYLNMNPKCEPQLGSRGLYRLTGGLSSDPELAQLAVLWVLNLSDGDHTLFDIAERSKLSFDLMLRAANALEECSLLERKAHGKNSGRAFASGPTKADE